MKTFFLGMGGDKASKIVDLFMSKGISACKDNKTASTANIDIQIFNAETASPITDTIIEIDGVPVSNKQAVSNLKIAAGVHHINVKNESYETLSKDVNIAHSVEYEWKIGLVPNFSRKSYNLLNIWMIIFMLFAPILWAGLRYAGLLGFSPTLDINYLNAAWMFDAIILIGAIIGYLFIGQYLRKAIKKQENTEFISTIGIFAGSVLSVLFLILTVDYVNPALVTYISLVDIMIITLLVIIFGIIGIVSLFTFSKHLSSKIKFPRLTLIAGTGIGALFGYGLASYLLKKVTDFDILTTKLGVDISYPFHPIIIALCAIIFGYIVSGILSSFLKRENSDLLGGLCAWGAAVATSIILMILFKITIPLVIAFFVGLTALGSFLGFIITYMIKRNMDIAAIFEIHTKTCTRNCSKGEFQYHGMCVVADTSESTLKNVVCIRGDNQVFVNIDISRREKDFNDVLAIEKERLKRKIKTIFTRIIENCVGYPDIFVVVADLRNNDLCTIIPSVLEFLKDEFRLPVYFICLTDPLKMNSKFMEKTGHICDAIFPVSYEMFEGAVNLGKRCRKINDEIIEEEIWEERAVYEILRRFGVMLEIGHRYSPSGIDTSHLLRLVRPLRIQKVCCDDNRMKYEIPDEQTDKINWCTIGYTSINLDRCSEFNFELELSNLILHTFHDLLWDFEANKNTVRSLFILRSQGKNLKTYLAKDIISKLFDGVVTMVSDLVVDDSPNLEIIGIFSNLTYSLPDKDSDDCSEPVITTPDDDGEITTPPIIKPTKVSDKDRWPITEQGYGDFCAKYGYTPLIAHIAQKIEKENTENWKKAKAAFEFARDSIKYKGDKESHNVAEYVQSPEETIDLGTGDCDDYAVLIGAILINMRIKVNFVFAPSHVYPAAYIPDAPSKYRTYRPSSMSDGTDWKDWIGMEATGKWEFGKLPESDYEIQNAYKVPGRN